MVRRWGSEVLDDRADRTEMFHHDVRLGDRPPGRLLDECDEPEDLERIDAAFVEEIRVLVDHQCRRAEQIAPDERQQRLRKGVGVHFASTSARTVSRYAARIDDRTMPLPASARSHAVVSNAFGYASCGANDPMTAVASRITASPT